MVSRKPTITIACNNDKDRTIESFFFV